MAVVKFLPRAEKGFLSLPPPLQDEILEKVKMLSRFSALGPRMERAYAGYRFLLVGKNWYRIIYKIVSPQLIHIAYIRHCKRQMGLRLIGGD